MTGYTGPVAASPATDFDRSATWLSHGLVNDGPADFSASWVGAGQGQSLGLVSGAIRMSYTSSTLLRYSWLSTGSSVDLIGCFGYWHIVGMANAQRGGFITASVAPLPAVPEPGSCALLIAGLAVLAGSAKRQIRRCAGRDLTRNSAGCVDHSFLAFGSRAHRCAKFLVDH